ncbi:MAG TPA: hypothetical protein VF658_05895 [Pyrinomonadaceae bacterium]
MRRLLISIASGVFVLSVMLGFALLMDVGLGLEPIATPFYWIIGWPMYLFSRVFPGRNPLYPDEVTTAAFVASVLFDVLIFSLLAYAFFRWREKNRLRRRKIFHESASNNGMHPTANSIDFIRKPPF